MKILFSFLAAALICGSAQAIEVNAGVPLTVADTIKKDLIFASQLTFTKQTPLKKQIFGDLHKYSLISFFDQRIKFLSFDSDLFKPFFAYVNTANPSTMVVTGRLFSQNVSQIARVIVMFHEARHAEIGNWLHIPCPEFFVHADKSVSELPKNLVGRLACDNTALGSYGVGSILANNISKYCENCNAKVKMDAELYYADSIDRVVNATARTILEKDYK